MIALEVQSIEQSSITIETMRDEARELILSGRMSRNQSLAALLQVFPKRETAALESMLSVEHEFSPSDTIGELLANERWDED